MAKSVINTIIVGDGLNCSTSINDQTFSNRAIFGQYNDTSGLSTTNGQGDILMVGAGTSNSARANCFAAGNDGTDDYIKVGDTKLTETQLQSLIALLA